MKIVIVNTQDVQGGAARAAYRLHKGLQTANIDSKYFVGFKYSKDKSIVAPYGFMGKYIAKFRAEIDKLPLRRYPQKGEGLFSPAVVPTLSHKHINCLDADVVHLHWITKGFLSIEEISKIKKPIVWTLHDMWAFTGGCHYDNFCNKFTHQCGDCPLLSSQISEDLAHSVFNRKLTAFKELNLTIIASSKWLTECASQSILFKNKTVKNIPNGIDMDAFKPLNKAETKAQFGLQENKPLILFGGMNPKGEKRKGYEKLQKALEILSVEYSQSFNIMIFGAGKNKMNVSGNAHYYNFGTYNNTNDLVNLYSSADVVIVPSIQENLSNIVVESLACGTPVVAFNIGGMPDMIDHQHNGYLAKPFDEKDLAHGIKWIIEDKDRAVELGRNARSKALNSFDMNIVSQRHREVYETLI